MLYTKGRPTLGGILTSVNALNSDLTTPVPGSLIRCGACRKSVLVNRVDIARAEQVIINTPAGAIMNRKMMAAASNQWMRDYTDNSEVYEETVGLAMKGWMVKILPMVMGAWSS